MEEISTECVPASICASEHEHSATPEQVVEMTRQLQRMMHDVVRIPPSADRDVIMHCIQHSDIHCLLSEIRITLMRLSPRRIAHNTITNMIAHHLHDMLQHLKQQLEEQYHICRKPDTRWLAKWIHPRIDSQHMLSTVNIIRQRYTRLLVAISGTATGSSGEPQTANHAEVARELDDVEI